MEPIADRINEIIKAKGLKKSEFAKRLGISPASVSTMCSGKSNPSGQTVTMICREFGVSEAWLRTGEGEMFVPAPSEELDALARRYGLTHAEYILIEKFVKASPATRDALVEFVADVGTAIQAADDSLQTPAMGGGLELVKSEIEAAVESAYVKNSSIASGTDASPSSTSEGTAGTA